MSLDWGLDSDLDLDLDQHLDLELELGLRPGLRRGPGPSPGLCLRPQPGSEQGTHLLDQDLELDLDQDWVNDFDLASDGSWIQLTRSGPGSSPFTGQDADLDLVLNQDSAAEVWSWLRSWTH